VKTKHRLISYFFSNTYAKNYRNRIAYVKIIASRRWDVFRDTVYRDTTVICAKTAEPIEMSFGLWVRMRPRNQVLDEGPQVLRDVAMATNFLLSLGYTFVVW